jgi:hypothetical protein
VSWRRRNATEPPLDREALDRVPGFRACPGTCAMYGECACRDFDTRHGSDAPALAEALRRLAADPLAPVVTDNGQVFFSGPVCTPRQLGGPLKVEGDHTAAPGAQPGQSPSPDPTPDG